MWLLLNQTVSVGHVLLGAVLAVLGPLAAAPLQLPPGRIRRPAVVVELAWLVFTDIVRSNVAVARLILGFSHRRRVSGLVYIWLDMREHYGRAILALIITSHPGTAWGTILSTTRLVLIHVYVIIDIYVFTYNIRNT